MGGLGYNPGSKIHRLAEECHARSAVLRFGPFDLDVRSGELRRCGQPIRMPPQPLKLLALLAGRRGMLVTREEIRTRLWGEDTFVDFEQGVNHCIREIRAILDDGARNPRFIETVPRRGYRFIAPIAGEAAAGAPGAAPALAAPPPEPHAFLAGVRRLGALLAMAAAVGSAPGRLLGPLSSALRRPDRVRMAVLPFDNLTGDPERQTLSDGLTEEVTTELGRLPETRVHVVCRMSAAAFKISPSPLWAARRHRVDYLLEGSLRCAEERVRVSAEGACPRRRLTPAPTAPGARARRARSAAPEEPGRCATRG